MSVPWSAAPALASFPSPPVGGFDIGFTEVRVYGILIATAVLVAATWTRRRYEGFGGDPELADRVTIWAVVIAFIGARLGYALPRYERFLDDPASLVQIWEGGLALYGGLTFGLLALIVLLRRWGGDFPAFMDALAPALPLAQAIGRWGNYFNQELYGTPTTVPWAVEIDPQHRVAPYQDFATFHPTFLYESLANLVLVGVLLRLERTGRLRRGSLILAYAVGYGTIRFLLELIRTDTDWRFLGLSRNALVSLVLIAGALALLRWWQGRPQAEEAAGDVDAGDGTGPLGDASDAGGDDPAVAGRGAAGAAAGSDEPTEASAVLVGVGDRVEGVGGGAAEPDDQDGPDGGDGEDDGDDPQQAGPATG